MRCSGGTRRSKYRRPRRWHSSTSLWLRVPPVQTNPVEYPMMNSIGLPYFQNLIRGNVRKLLHLPARPMNLDQLDRARAPQSEMNALVAGREITPGRGHHRVLLLSTFRNNFHSRADAVMIARYADCVDQNPMIFSRPVLRYHRRPVVIVQDNIHIPVVIQIAESRSARGQFFPEETSRTRRNIGKISTNIPQQQRRLQIMYGRLRQLNVVHYVALRNKEILPSVIVEICEFRAPAGMRHRGRRDALRIRNIFKLPLNVVEQRVSLIRQRVDENIGPAVIVVIREIRPHARESVAILVIRDPK